MSQRKNEGFKEPSAPLVQRNDACQEFGTHRREGGPGLNYFKVSLKALVKFPGEDGADMTGYAD